MLSQKVQQQMDLSRQQSLAASFNSEPSPSHLNSYNYAQPFFRQQQALSYSLATTQWRPSLETITEEEEETNE
jgi:hypothetical protein